MFVNNDHESSTNMISVINKIAKELFDYCKHPQNEISIEKCCLKISSRMFTISKMFNHLVHFE